MGGPCRDWPPRDNDVDPELDQLGRILTEPLDVARTPPVLHDDVLALDIPKLAETLDESLATAGTGAWYEGEKPYPGDPPWQLRLGCERHQEESEGDEAPDGAAPRGGLLPLASCMPAMTVHTADRRAHDPLLAMRDTPLLFVSSTAEEAERHASGAANSWSDIGA